MNCQDHLYRHANPKQVTRRWFFEQCGVGLGADGARRICWRDRQRRADGNPLAPKQPHFAPKAKRVIFLFMAGAPSHLELFDNKPQLAKFDGTLPPAELLKGYRAAFINPNSKLLGPKFKFAKHGQSGAELSELLPHLAKVVDDIAIVKSMVTDAFNHAPGQIAHEHRLAAVRPAEHGRVGDSTAWAASRRTCPASSSSAPARRARAAAIRYWGSGFLPTVYQGVQFRSGGDPVLYLSNPQRRGSTSCSATRSTRSSSLNQMRLDVTGDPEIATRINSFEMAYRMQIERAGADGPVARSRSRRWRCTAPSRASRRSPTTACWRGGWSSAACASCSSSTRPGTSTATW